ncbi:biotin-dependent carboxyltransferase [Aquimarina sp. AD1]|uniref:5-oxoprolinase subunit C family protein n=1 Tax=Aquimarina sp. (strain AD1) TaxID=1714848 RepID=UPI000E554C24|nr:biotin-dependent carboxyltransferase family protein [Aquimarina sp. AD1]AXT55854.1 biotin-dependent carboxyltransferase [Aquimarina sp. AD1]RKN15146.1 biotin-dependent carboxyltransferase [Aquimarina sp. AD1]
MKGKVELLSSGVYTTIQDGGRFGYSKYGVPKSGAMDLRSFFLANAILNNEENSAVLEWTLVPPVLKFHQNTIVSITGAICDPYLNDVPCKMNSQIEIEKNDILKFKNVLNGVYGYVGIFSGFLSEFVLSSRSQYNQITKFSRLFKNDMIAYNSVSRFSTSNSLISSTVFWDELDSLNVYKGPEFDMLSETQKDILLNHDFTISDIRNRMAISLEESLENDLSSMLSSPVLPGTVQLTPSGRLIVLMRDCQTTGGYPRILQLTKESINAIAQKRTGDTICFDMIN